jgi:hypothetical protein
MHRWSYEEEGKTYTRPISGTAQKFYFKTWTEFRQTVSEICGTQETVDLF